MSDGTIDSSSDATHDLDLTVNSASVDHFVFATISSPQTAGAPFDIDVTAEDAYDNTATSFSGTATLSTTADTISPTTSGAFAGGLRTESVTVTQSGSSKSISVDDGAGHTGISNSFNVNPGPLDHFGISSISTPQTAGSAFSVWFTAQDANNNTVTSFTGTADLTTTAGGISPTISGTFVSGVRTESIVVTQTGSGRTITATNTAGAESGTSNTFTVDPGVFVKLQLLVPGETAASGTPGGKTGTPSVQGAGISFSVTVNAVDANWNLVNTVTDVVSISSSDGTATLPPNAGLSAGRQTFSITLNTAGTQTISASDITDGTKTSNTSPAITVNPDSVDHFVIATISSPQTAGGAFSIDITAEDALNNTVTGFTGAVNLSTTAGTISPTVSGSFIAGLRTESVSVTQAGAGQMITADDGIGHVGTSNAFTVVAGAATQVMFTTQPGNATGGSLLSTQPVVEVQDANGNTVTTSGANVTLAIGTNPGSGTLGGTTTVAAVNGVATFTDLSIDSVGSGYTLVASSPSLSSATSSTFDITVGAAAAIGLTSGNGQSGVNSSVLANPFVVTVTDAGGNGVSGVSVTFGIASVPGGATGQSLTVTNAVTNASGQASTVLTLGDKVGGYTVTATSLGLSGSPVSFSATATTGAATAIAMVSGNGQSALILSTLSAPLVVQVSDGSGNPVAGVAVNFGITGVPAGATGESLSVTTATTDGGGRAQTSLTVGNKVGAYAIDATSAGLSGSPVSFIATTTAGAASQLVFVVQPGNGTGGMALSVQPVVEVRDAGANVVTSFSGSVTVTIGSNPAGGTLGGSMTVAAVNGVATFIDLSIDKAGSGYTLVASASGLGSTTSSSFDVNIGPGVSISLRSGNYQSGLVNATPAAPLVVVVTDAGGNGVSGVSVMFATTATPSGATGQILSVTNATTDATGEASTSLTFGDKLGSYTVAAISAGLSGSPVFFSAEAVVGMSAAIALQSGDNQSGPINTTFVDPFVVRVTDEAGSGVSGVSVSFVITAAPSGATGQSLSVTTTTTDVSGEASTYLTLGSKIGEYTVEASSAGLSGSPVTFGASTTIGLPALLVFTMQPGDGEGGSLLSLQPVVEVQDAGGNRVTTSSASVSVAIGTNPGGGTLGGTATVVAVNGVGTFSDLTIDRAGTDYTLVATSAGLSQVVSDPFTISAGAGIQLAFIVEPGNGLGGESLSVQPQVVVQDAGGNRVMTSSGEISVTIGNNPAGGSLSGMAAVAVVEGIALFNDLAIDRAASGYTLVATSAGLRPATSDAFDIGVGAAVAVGFITQPGNGEGGSPLSQQPVVGILDAGGNTVTTSSASVTVSIWENPSDGALSGTMTVAAVNGVATYIDLSIDKAGNGYELLAFSSGLISTESNPFDVVVGPAAQLAFIVEPGHGTGGSALSPQPVVAVEDAGGNVVTTSSALVSVSIGNNPTAGTLSGTASIPAEDGVATFTDLSIDRIGTGYTLVALSTPMTSATSDPFDVSVGAASLLMIASGNDQVGVAGTALGDPFVVSVYDAGSNPVPGVELSFAITSTPAGASGQQLSVTDATSDVSGQASSVLTLGNKTGIYLVTITFSGSSGNPMTFVATAREPDGTGLATIDLALPLVSVETTGTITVIGDGRATNASISVTIPAGWGWSGDASEATLAGQGFVAASVSVSGNGSQANPYVITVVNTSVTTADEGTMFIERLVPPASAGFYDFLVSTAAVGGILMPIENSPSVEVRELVIGDANLDGSVNIIDVVLAIDFILGREPMNAVQRNVTDVYPAHASPRVQGPRDGLVDVSDMILIQNAILNGAWDDGTMLVSGNGSSSANSSGLPSGGLASGGDASYDLSEDVLITFEVYDDFIAVRLTNPVPVKGLQFNLKLKIPSVTDETEKFNRVDHMSVRSKIVGLRHTILLFDGQNRAIEPADEYVLLIKGDWRAYDISQTDIIAVDDQNSPLNVVYRWPRGEPLPRAIKLEQNYPNPFNPSTTIEFQLPDFTEVKITIVDILGRRVKTLARGEMNPGVHRLVWDGTDEAGRRVASGVYLYRMQAGDFTKSKKMLLVK